MLVKIKQKHFRLATSFDFPNCPLKFALQDLYPKSKVYVGGFDAYIDNKRFTINSKWGEEISVEEINQNIKLAKSKKKAKSYDIELS